MTFTPTPHPAEGESPAELWEERRKAHWQLMRDAWLRWQALVAEHERLGFADKNPWEAAHPG
jgi:hypothetical protein